MNIDKNADVLAAPANPRAAYAGELLLTAVVASRGVVIAASNLGKWKTATTMTSICGLLFVYALPTESCAALPLALAFQLLLVVAMALTAWSGIDYFAKSWKYLVEED